MKYCWEQRDPLLWFLGSVLVTVAIGAVGRYQGWRPDFIAVAMAASVAFAVLQLGRFLAPGWFVGLLLIAFVAFYTANLAHQANVTNVEGRSTWEFPVSAVGMPKGAKIHISYPRIIPREPTDKPGWPIYVYFWPPVPRSGTALLAAGIEQQEMPAPATAQQVLTFTVFFVPAKPEVIEFTDKGGTPVAPSIRVRWGGTQDEPAALYVRQAMAFSWDFPVPITVSVSARDEQGAELLKDADDKRLEFVLEDARSAWSRRFLSAVFGPTTPVLSFAGAIIGLGIWWWQHDKERKERERAEKEKEEKERKNAVAKPRALVERFKSSQNRDERERYLRAAVAALQKAQEQYGTDPKAQAELQQTLERVRWAQLEHIRLTGDCTNFANLQERKDEEQWRDESLLRLFSSVKGMCEKPERRPPYDPPAIIHWCKAKGLKFNPFGPEKAEEDPWFSEKRAQPPGWDRIQQPEPTVVWGASGSGLTAARLYLMESCGAYPTPQYDKVIHPLGGESHRLAVPLVLPIEMLSGYGKPALWKALTLGIARTNLALIAETPALFGPDSPLASRQALARLFRLHRPSLGDATVYLQGLGLPVRTARDVGSQIAALARHLQVPRFWDDRELIALLRDARLGPFEHQYVCVEIVGDEPENVQGVVATLYTIMGALAKVNAFVKLFIPVKPNGHEGVELVELEWTEEQIRELLKQRLTAAGAAEDVKSLFPRVKGDLEDWLVEAAQRGKDAPRRLIRFGNALVKEDATQSPLDDGKAKDILR
ncbi:MAG: hypothetical protein ACUVWA_15320 [Candidatus Oleimicrobiaceae bacterium]